MPRKNARILDGQPLISWAIAACRQSEVFDDIVVSTDDDEIARIAEVSGAQVPFLRPADLSDDHTPLVPVVAHAIRSLEEHGTQVTLACCVYPTAITLLPGDLSAALHLLEASPTAPYVIGVARYSHPIQRAMTLTPGGHLEMAHPEESQTRTQDLPVHWYDAGQFVWGRREAWLGEVRSAADTRGPSSFRRGAPWTSIPKMTGSVPK